MAALKPDDSNHPMADPSAGPVLPAAYSVLAVEPLLSEVERLYRLVSPSTGQLLRSWANDVYEVATTAERYVLKVYRDRWRSADEVIWEAELQAYLLGQWVPVAPIVPRPRGELTGSVRAPDGERTITLTRYVQGAKPDSPLTAQFYHRMGRLCAQIHQASDGYTSTRHRPELDLAALIDEPLATILPWLESRPDHRALVETAGATLRDDLKLLIAQGMDWRICHGDFSLDNIHVTDGGFLVLHDFDYVACSWRAVDLHGVQLSERGNWDAFLILLC